MKQPKPKQQLSTQQASNQTQVNQQIRPFWEVKSFVQMSSQEWESLCDGCGKCCLQKLEDEDTGEVYYTDVACRYLANDCRCSQYQRRAELVAECITLTADNIAEFYWLPATCAYRLVAEAKPLPPWHHLVSTDTQLIHQLGESVQGRVISEELVDPDDLEEHIIHWID